MNFATFIIFISMYSSSPSIECAQPKSNSKVDASILSNMDKKLVIEDDKDTNEGDKISENRSPEASPSFKLSSSTFFSNFRSRKPMLHLRKSWSTGFATAVKTLRTVAYNVPKDVKIIRKITDNAIPTWLPTLPRGVECKSSKEPPGEWYFPTSIRETFLETHVHTKASEEVIELGVGVHRKGLHVLYLHGGAFCVCNTGSHRGILFRIVDGTGACVFAVDYRRPPEHPHPAPVDDCLAAYKFLLQTVNASQIVFMGDSAGGGLVISTMLAARDQGIPLPAAAVLLSPWVDLAENATDSWTRNEPYDYIPMHLAKYFAENYRGSASWEDVSPACADNLSGLPPLLIECGECEVLVDQIVNFAAKCVAAGILVELNVREDMVHVFQMFCFTKLPQCVQSFKTISDFCLKAVPPASESMVCTIG